MKKRENQDSIDFILEYAFNARDPKESKWVKEELRKIKLENREILKSSKK